VRKFEKLGIVGWLTAVIVVCSWLSVVGAPPAPTTYTNIVFPLPTATPTASAVWCINDGAANPGLTCNIGNSSTNGYQWGIGGSVPMQLAGNSTLQVQSNMVSQGLNGILNIGNDNTAQNSAIFIGNGTGVQRDTQIGTSAANNVGGIVTNIFGIAQQGVAWLLALDASGNFAVKGYMAAARSGASTVAAVPPVYTTSGANLATTTHCVSGNTGNTTAGAITTVTLSGAAVFTSNATYFVEGEYVNGLAAPSGLVGATMLSATQFEVQNNSGGTNNIVYLACGY